MSNDITIVTAFFDIGRGNWTADKGFPFYLHRTTDEYFERFSRLAELENEMFIFTSKDLVKRVTDLRGNRPTTVIEFDLVNELVDLRKQIKSVYASADYQKMINFNQRANPEYWNADYVIINLLKSTFACMASEQAKNNVLAWVDFGYCRSESTLNGVKHWRYNFDADRIHMFKLKDFAPDTDIQHLIANNDVHITGPCIIASKENWKKLEFSVLEGVKELLKHGMIDDDQLFLLLAYLSKPELFELHQVSPDNWFTVFRDYNENIS